MRAYLFKTSVTATGALTLTATGSQTVDADVLSGSVAVAGGLVGVGLGGAGSVASNRIAAWIAATIDGGGATIAVRAASVTLTATDTSEITATTGAAALSVGVGLVGAAASVGIALARNEIANRVEASITGVASLVTTTGGVTLSATEHATITATTAAAAFAASGGLAGISFAGAGAVARNVILTRTAAAIADSDVRSAAGVSLTATSTGTTINALVAAAADALAIGGFAGAVAIGFARAENFIGWDPYTVTPLDPEDTFVPDLTTASTPSSVTSGQTVLLVGGPAAGYVYEYIGSADLAPLAGESTVDLAAQDYTDATLWRQRGTTAAGGTSASITDSTLAARTLTLTATSGQTIDAEVEAASVALAGGGIAVAAAAAGVYALNRIGQATQASITGGTLTVDGDGTTAITLTATDTSAITATGGAASVAAAIGFGESYSAAIAGAIAHNAVTSVVAAVISGATVRTTSGLTSLSATNTADVDATSTAAALSVSLSGASLAGGGATELVSVTTTTTAAVSGGTLTLGGGLDLAASDTSTAGASVAAAAIAIGFAAAGSLVLVDVSPTTTASISDATVTVAGPVSVTAIEHATALATAAGNSYGSFAAAGSIATATLGAAVSALISGGAVTSTSAGITVTARYNATDAGANDAPGGADHSVRATAAASSGALIASSGAFATASDVASVTASASGGTLAARDAITLFATSWSAPKALTEAGGAGLGIVGSAATAATADVATTAALDGDVTGAASLTVRAIATERPDAASTSLSGGGFGSVDVTAEATADGVVEARIGAGYADVVGTDAPTITVTGAVTVTAESTMTATVLGDTTTIAGVGLTDITVAATVSGTTRAFVRDGVTLTAASLVVSAGTTATRVDLDATATITLLAVSILGGSVGATVTVIRPTASVSGVTRAYAGAGTSVRTAGLDIDASAQVRAEADASAISVTGLGSGTGIEVAATTASVVEAYLGVNAGDATSTGTVDVRTTAGGPGTVTLDARSEAEALATATGGSGSFGITVTNILPVARVQGVTRAYIGPRTTLTAGTVTATAVEDAGQAHATAQGRVGGLLAGVSTLSADARYDRITEASVGAGATVTAGALTLIATTSFTSPAAVAEAGGGNGGLVSVATYDALATVGQAGDLGGVTRAAIGAGATVTASSVTMTATSQTEATSIVTYLGVGGFASSSSSQTTATAGHDTEAIVGSGAILTLTGALTVTATGTSKATPAISGGAGSLGVSVQLLEAKSLVTARTRSAIDDAAQVTAGSVTLSATATHTARSDIGTTSIAGLVSANVIKAIATDSGAVSVWIGPGAGLTGSDDTPTTVSGTTGISASATLTSTVVTSPKLTSFSIAASGGSTRSLATQSATVLARVGNHSALTSTAGDISVLAEFIGSTHATGSGAQAAAGVTIAAAEATASHAPTITAEVAAGASLTTLRSSGLVALTARHNHTGTDPRTTYLTSANSNNLAIAGLAAVSTSDATATANPTTAVTAAAGSTFSAPSGTVRLSSLAYVRAVGTINSSSGGLVRVSTARTRPTAAGTTTATFFGDIGTTATAGAVNLEVTAYERAEAVGSVASTGGGLVSVSSGSSDTEATPNVFLTLGDLTTVINVSGALTASALGEASSRATMSTSGGGAVTVTSGTAKATTSPELAVNIGSDSTSAVWINADGNITIQGIQESDADSLASGAGGAAVAVSSFTSEAIVTQQVEGGVTRPTVAVTINNTNLLRAGGTLRLLAQHSPVTFNPNVSDGTVKSVDASDGPTGNYLTFTVAGSTTSFAHLLSTGQVITYTGECCGLENGRAYSVIRKDAYSVYLGALFGPANVNLSADTITFTKPHTFVTGDLVRFHASGGTITGLDSGAQYEVFVVDTYSIKLRLPGTGGSATSSAVDAATDTITTSTAHGYANDTPVVYHAPAGIEIVSIGSDHQTIETATAHGFSSFQAVYYDKAGSHVLTGLTPGTVYTAFVIDSTHLKLVVNICNARGDDYPYSYCLLDAGGEEAGDEDYIDQLFISIYPEEEGSALHTIASIWNSPIVGLVNGQTYYVTEATATTFKLGASTSASTVVDLGTTDAAGSYVRRWQSIKPGLGWWLPVNGSGHVFTYEGIDLTAKTGVGTFTLVHDLTAPGTTPLESFTGLSGLSALGDATSGDAEVTATTASSSGGAVSVENSTARTSVTVTTTLTVKNGAVLEGGTVELLTHSRIDVNSTIDSLGVGAIAVGNPYAEASGQNNSTLTVEAGALVTSHGTLEVRDQRRRVRRGRPRQDQGHRQLPDRHRDQRPPRGRRHRARPGPHRSGRQRRVEVGHRGIRSERQRQRRSRQQHAGLLPGPQQQRDHGAVRLHRRRRGRHHPGNRRDVRHGAHQGGDRCHRGRGGLRRLRLCPGPGHHPGRHQEPGTVHRSGGHHLRGEAQPALGVLLLRRQLLVRRRRHGLVGHL